METSMSVSDLAEFEKAYRLRLQSGQTRWHPGAYEDFEMRPFLDAMTASLGRPLQGLRVLDLGCGTGQASVYFAAQGAIVTGVDAAPTAIDFARRYAAERALPATFYAGDVRAFHFPPGSFDLAIDCSFLHCVVSPGDREAVLSRVAGWLQPGGEFWSETMIGVPEIRASDDYFLDETGVFWKYLGEGTSYPESVERDRQTFSPVRRIIPEVSLFNQELARNGFQIISQEQVPPADPYSVWMVRTRACV
jgi:SAM-dependent methyltransferase